MKLESFQVRMFRNVIDSGPILVGMNTCLVGKNEAGKSAIIEALHRLNPAKPEAKFLLLEDYPRWLKKAHELDGSIESVVPITATFHLEQSEIDRIESRYGKNTLRKPKIVVSRPYTGNVHLVVDCDESSFIDFFTHDYIPADLRPHINATSVSDLKTSLAQTAQMTDENKQSTDEAALAKQAETDLKKLLGEHCSVAESIAADMQPRIPRTFLFSQYAQLIGRYNLDSQIIPALQSSPKEEEVQTAAQFLKLARLDPSSASTWDFEECNAELEAVSSMLTTLVRKNWKQNEHLKLKVRIETQKGSGSNPDRFLQFRVEDTRHDFTNRLDRRSTGFRWFVSFIAAFFEFQSDQEIILLLDEPGLSLHARAQKDLLDAIDTTLANGRQVIYTTHSPFMVRTESLDKARIVEDGGPDCGSRVTNEAGVISDPDTLFPLQAALGYDIAQNLFIGNRNILVEGTSDFIYLSVLSSHLNALGRSYIPDNARLLPAGGATNIPTFIALLGGKLNLVVLLDGNAQRQRIDDAVARGRLNANRVFTVSQFSDVKGADIEDLFEPDEYLAMYNGTFNKSVEAKDLLGEDRIVKRIERSEGEFDHGRVAAYFLARQCDLVPLLSSGTVTRFEKLIDTLVGALPSVP